MRAIPTLVRATALLAVLAAAPVAGDSARLPSAFGPNGGLPCFA